MSETLDPPTDEDQCEICHDSLSTKWTTTLIPCDHKFDFLCIGPWISRCVSLDISLDCPKCRSPIDYITGATGTNTKIVLDVMSALGIQGGINDERGTIIPVDGFEAMDNTSEIQQHIQERMQQAQQLEELAEQKLTQAERGFRLADNITRLAEDKISLAEDKMSLAEEKMRLAEQQMHWIKEEMCWIKEQMGSIKEQKIR